MSTLVWVKRIAGLCLCFLGLFMAGLGTGVLNEYPFAAFPVSQIIVGGEPYLRLHCPYIGRHVEVNIGPVRAIRDTDNTFLVRMSDVLQSGIIDKSGATELAATFTQHGGQKPMTMMIPVALSTGAYLHCEQNQTAWTADHVLSGFASRGAVVSCQGKSVTVGYSGKFGFPVNLPQTGAYTFKLTARRDGEDLTTRQVSVVRKPRITINPPPQWVAAQSFAVSGYVCPELSLTVDGAPVRIGPETGFFSHTVSLGQEKTRTVAVRIKDGGGSVIYEKGFPVTVVGPEEAYKRLATTIPYAELDKDAARYRGKIVRYTGSIMDIAEGRTTNYMLVEVTQNGSYWQDTIWVNYSWDTSLLEGDIVTFWGDLTGDYTYQSVAGWKLTVPCVTAKYLQKGWYTP